ncbi:MAG: VCBS repeat-containing protein [Planctomycetes bacterium]|nr:VCBS repeat-containing protein [Planctomycetota bacterium]
MHATFRVVSLGSLLAAAAAAQGTPPPIPVELRSRFGFEGPLITKIGDGIGNLRIADFDGDGKLEAVVSDARRARLVILRTDGTQTTLDPVPTRGQIAGYALADVHGDGKADLLLVDARGRLTVQHPGGDATTAPLDLGLGGRGVGLQAGDLDGDGKQDLVALVRGKMRWVTDIAGQPKLSAIEPLEDNVHSFHVVDVDGDGHVDFVCCVAGTKMNLRLRRGHGDGTFGPWRIAGVDDLLHVFPARLADGGNALATIEGPHRRVSLQTYADHGGDAALEWWSFDEGQKDAPMAVGDLDGDGDDDVVVLQPERAQMTFFEWRDGTFVPRPLPTLAGVASVAIGDVDRDGRLDLVLASPEEETLAWQSGARPLDEFPVQIACVDKPVAVAVHPAGGVLVLARTDKRDAHIDRVAPGGEPQRLVELGRLPADPVRLLAADVGDADGLELAFVVPSEGLRTVSIGGAGTDVKKVGKGDGTAGFTRKMDDGALALCVHEGQPALLAVRERFVRRFRVDEAGQVRVLTQDNGPEGLAELSLAAELPGGAMLYLDKKNDKLVRTRPGAPATAIEVPAFDFTRLLAHGDAAVLVSTRGLLRVPFGGGPSLRPVAVHEPPTDRTYYWSGEYGDFDHDGRIDLVVVDRRLPGVQILAGGEGRLDRAVAVPVFEAPPSDQPDSEPRELATGDLDGDGRTDFVLLAHDRVLIYLQQK